MNLVTDKDTPLMRALSAAELPQPTPMMVFKLARKQWAACRRISIGELAATVGVSRVTLYRWVGSREQLIEEILWSFAKPTFASAANTAPGKGVEHIVETHRRFMTDLAAFEPMRWFLLDNPTEAIRIQTNDPSSAHSRLIVSAQAQLVEQERLGHLKLAAPAARIAELIVFTNGALLYSAIIGARDAATAIEQACIIDRLLLMGKFEAKSKPSARKQSA